METKPEYGLNNGLIEHSFSMASVPSEEDNLDSSTESGTSQISSDFGENTSEPGISLSLSLLFSV